VHALSLSWAAVCGRFESIGWRLGGCSRLSPRKARICAAEIVQKEECVLRQTCGFTPASIHHIIARTVKYRQHLPLCTEAEVKPTQKPRWIASMGPPTLHDRFSVAHVRLYWRTNQVPQPEAPGLHAVASFCSPPPQPNEFLSA
jgi:hypothetical protein